MTSFKFQLSLTADVGASFVPFLRKRVVAAHRLVKAPLRDLSVVLVNDRNMAVLHRRFMNVAGPTDVLTFPLEIDRHGRPMSGEIVLCVPEARRAAKLHGTSVERELLLYAIHGMLHLCGFDDRTASAYKKMHRKEDQILTRLGVGPVFAPTRRPPRQRRRTSRGAG